MLGRGKGEGAGGRTARTALPRAAAPLCPLPTLAGAGQGASIAAGQRQQRVPHRGVPAGPPSRWVQCWLGRPVLGGGDTGH